jgi:hypothetical protein
MFIAPEGVPVLEVGGVYFHVFLSALLLASRGCVNVRQTQSTAESRQSRAILVYYAPGDL